MNTTRYEYVLKAKEWIERHNYLFKERYSKSCTSMLVNVYRNIDEFKTLAKGRKIKHTRIEINSGSNDPTIAFILKKLITRTNNIVRKNVAIGDLSPLMFMSMQVLDDGNIGVVINYLHHQSLDIDTLMDYSFDNWSITRWIRLGRISPINYYTTTKYLGNVANFKDSNIEDILIDYFKSDSMVKIFNLHTGLKTMVTMRMTGAGIKESRK